MIVSQLTRTSHKHMAQIPGTILVTAYSEAQHSVLLVVQVRQVEKLGREEVTFFSLVFISKRFLVYSKELQSDTSTSLRRNWSAAEEGAGVRASQMCASLCISPF